ncbi:toll/interleukin-1 receptor domain-containing protein [Indioceanicola profundi]|uniref:toll/interleukin-1 receptor domain-containing protein n=1 Tax=Indioceanicola profundi TaxID=2220096 RepID=UPI001CEC2823|nr:toll/interleukin-1 receptor domain-containing protein [Indioceanicola profundi]
MLALYELGVLGGATSQERKSLLETVGALVAPFGLRVGSELLVLEGQAVASRNPKAAFAAAYFGGDPHADEELTERVVRSSVPVIPTVGPGGDFIRDIPTFLHASNGLRRRADDQGLVLLASAMLECLGLLRRQRRVFVSYRRIESRAAAVQLHDLFTARGFDVFLDTHDIRPGEPFQDVLWHRLCDSDVMVMLDTPTYFESKWTRQEICRARAKEIHVLRVVWPGHSPSRLTEMAETVYLEAGDLEGEQGPISTDKVDAIVLAAEGLRSRSIASRHMSLVGHLRMEAERAGATIEGVGAHRAISLRSMGGKHYWVYPVVGIPTAELLNDVHEKAARAEQHGMPVLAYNHVGISEQWVSHLKWLDANIASVRTLKVLEAAWTLGGWEE